MTEVASARINTFGPSPKAGFESPSDQLIVLTYAQLQDHIKGAIEQAIQPLQDEIAQFREEIDQDHQEIEALRARTTSLESALDQEISRVCMDIAYDRKRLAKLENPIKEPGKTETARAEKIEKYLASRPDHKATFETLKGMLQINNVLLNQAIKTLMDSSPGRYGITKAQGDKRKRTLVMLPR
jgi:chromosome segregation ATPase